MPKQRCYYKVLLSYHYVFIIIYESSLMYSKLVIGLSIKMEIAISFEVFFTSTFYYIVILVCSLYQFVFKRNSLSNFMAKCDLCFSGLIDSNKVSRYISYSLLRIAYRIGSFGKRIVTSLTRVAIIIHILCYTTDNVLREYIC